MRRVFTIAAVVGLLCVMAVPASADKPFVWMDETFVNDDILFEDATAECGFNVYVTETIKARGTDHFDKDGSFVFGTMHFKGTSYYRSDDVTLPKAEHWSWVGTFDVEAFTFTLRGNAWGLIGILEERGRIVFDESNGDILFEAGNWPVVHDGFGPLCDALSLP